MRPRVRVLLPTWNPFYVRMCLEFCIPSLLAPGNLPALAAETECELVILTREADRPLLEESPIYQALQAVLPVQILDLSDLVVEGLYGFTLTYGFLRAMEACGEAMTRTHFVFLVGDCVVADGSFRSLVRPILEGRSMVLGGNVRAVYEDVAETLRGRVTPETGALAVPPRELVAHTIRHLHPTALGRVYNQDACHVVQPNFLLWKVDEATLLCHCFSMHMLCLRPERSDFRIDGYCDYAFVPEMCPSGDVVVLDDSDQFFMLELQRRAHEAFFLRLGRPTLDELGRGLWWTTAEHRQGRAYGFVFHADEPPPALEAVRAEAKTVVEAIHERIGAAPAPHNGHPFWTGNVARFQSLRPGVPAADASVPSPIAAPTPEASGLRRIAGRLRGLLVGRPPFVRPWHPDWLDFRALTPRLEEALRALAPSDRVLHVATGDDPLAQALARSGREAVRFTPPETFLSAPAGSREFALGVLSVGLPDLVRLRSLTDAMRTRLRPGATLFLFLRSRQPGGADATETVIAAIGDLERIDLPVRRFVFAGGAARHTVRRQIDRSDLAWLRPRALRLLARGALQIALLAASGLANWKSLGAFEARRHVDHVTSVFVEIEAP